MEARKRSLRLSCAMLTHELVDEPDSYVIEAIGGQLICVAQAMIAEKIIKDLEYK